MIYYVPSYLKAEVHVKVGDEACSEVGQGCQEGRDANCQLPAEAIADSSANQRTCSINRAWKQRNNSANGIRDEQM